MRLSRAQVFDHQLQSAATAEFVHAELINRPHATPLRRGLAGLNATEGDGVEGGTFTVTVTVTVTITGTGITVTITVTVTVTVTTTAPA